jgi:26S proteasome non-ATPase regulatory subunit 10
MILRTFLMLQILILACAFTPRPFEGRIMYRGSIKCSVDDIGRKIYDAAYANNLEKLKTVLLECKGNKAALNWRNMERYGRTPLVIAAYYNKIESVKLLLSTPGVDINASSDFGATALHFAAHRGHLEVVQLLLSKGAKVNALATGGKWTGKTPLDVVSGMGMSGKPEVSAALVSKGGKPGK